MVIRKTVVKARYCLSPRENHLMSAMTGATKDTFGLRNSLRCDVPNHVTVRRGTVGHRTGLKIEAFEDVEGRRFSSDLDVDVEPQE